MTNNIHVGTIVWEEWLGDDLLEHGTLKIMYGYDLGFLKSHLEDYLSEYLAEHTGDLGTHHTYCITLHENVGLAS